MEAVDTARRGAPARRGRPTMNADAFAALRQSMIAEIAAQAIYVSARIGKAAFSRSVLQAMERIPRHAFVPAELQPYAYANTPLPIGFDKTISQPFIVALMTDALDLEPSDRVLEVGTGLGYQAAIVASLARRVYSIEVIEELSHQAKQRLGRLRLDNIELRIGNGRSGWPDEAPFDKIIVTAAPDLIPPTLIHQLKRGGKMVIPAGLAEAQQLILVEKDAQGKVATRELLPVRFSLLEGTETLGSPTLPT